MYKRSVVCACGEFCLRRVLILHIMHILDSTTTVLAYLVIPQRLRFTSSRAVTCLCDKILTKNAQCTIIIITATAATIYAFWLHVLWITHTNGMQEWS